MRAAGMKRDDIAAELGCSTGTVDREIRAIRGEECIDRYVDQDTTTAATPIVATETAAALSRW